MKNIWEKIENALMLFGAMFILWVGFQLIIYIKETNFNF